MPPASGSHASTAERKSRAVPTATDAETPPPASPARQDPPAPGVSREAVAETIALLDLALRSQITAILEHPRLKELEASWRGLASVVEQFGPRDNVKARLLVARWDELERDLELGPEDSTLFHLVYGEIDRAGGEPFGFIAIDHDLDVAGPAVDILRSLAGIAAAAFAPFVAAASPRALGLDRFEQLGEAVGLRPAGVERLTPEWRSFRDHPDARFLALALPRVLVRPPRDELTYRGAGLILDDARTPAPDRRVVWGSPVYPIARRAVQTFVDTGWFADMAGLRPDSDDGGWIPDTFCQTVPTERADAAWRIPTEVALTHEQEHDLAQLGFIALVSAQFRAGATVFTTQTTQRPALYETELATGSARLSAQLRYVMCACRVAHCVKVRARDLIGSVQGPEDLERELNDWLGRYTLSDDHADTATKARYPIRESSVRVQHASGAGSFSFVLRIRPHHQLEGLFGRLRIDASDGDDGGIALGIVVPVGAGHAPPGERG